MTNNQSRPLPWHGQWYRVQTGIEPALVTARSRKWRTAPQQPESRTRLRREWRRLPAPFRIERRPGTLADAG